MIICCFRNTNNKLLCSSQPPTSCAFPFASSCTHFCRHYATHAETLQYTVVVVVVVVVVAVVVVDVELIINNIGIYQMTVSEISVDICVATSS